MNETTEFLIQHGALALFVAVFIEQIGLPLPAAPLLIAAGVLAGTGHMSIWLAVGVTALAALLADGVWYELGRRYGRRMLGLLCRISLEPDSCVRRTEDFFMKHGPHSLVVAKFIPGLSTIAPPLAGIVGLSVPLFLVYDGLGVAIWTGFGIGIGYVFSGQIEQALLYANQMTPALAATLMAGLIGYVVYKRTSRRRQLRQVPRMTVAQLAQKLETNDPPLLIDVRPHAGVDAEPGIPGALHVPFDELTLRYEELPRNRELLLYCSCPEDAASVQGAILLRTKGFASVWPLAGGIEAWRVVNSPAEDVMRLYETNPVAA